MQTMSEHPAEAAPAPLPTHGIDFAKVEMLRRQMLLSTNDMARAMGVTRMTYYTWVRGGPLRSTSVPKVKRQLKKLLVIYKTQWPTEEMAALTRGERTQHLLELLDQEQ